jgi:hypothetical protein
MGMPTHQYPKSAMTSGQNVSLRPRSADPAETCAPSTSWKIPAITM